MKKTTLFDYNLSTGDIKEYAEIVADYEFSKTENSNVISFLNPHSFVEAEKIEIFKSSLKNSKFLFIDGVGINLFATNTSNRIIGYDFYLEILKNLNKKNFSNKIFFLGSKIQILNEIKKRVNNEFKNINVCGLYQPSFVDLEFSEKEIEIIVEQIKKCEPNIIFVGLTAPKQEILSYRLSKVIKNKTFINIGAVFDYYSRNKPMPNKFIRKFGLEWLFRLVTDYSKIKKRVFSSTIIFLKIIFVKKYLNKYNNLNSEFYILDNIKNIKYISSNSILVAFNLAFLAFYTKNIIKYNKDIVLWPDGISTKIFSKDIKKIPGHKLIDSIDFKKFNKIVVFGNLLEKEREYLKKKNHRSVEFNQLPIFSYRLIENLKLNLGSIKENDIVLITLPTPKQELLANIIRKKKPNTLIVCVGGGISIASGRIRECPEFLDKLGLESLWRLQTDTVRRIKRIFVSIYYAAQFFMFRNKETLRLKIFEKKN